MYSVKNVLKTIRENTGQLGVVEAHIKQTMQLTLDVSSEIIERNEDGLPIDDKMSKLQKLMSTYVQLEADVVLFKSAVEDLCSNMTEVSENSSELLREAYLRLRSSAPKPESHTLYKDLMETIEEGRKSRENVVPETQKSEEENNDDDDEDLVSTQEQGSIPIDPLTKREVTDPVRNKICKHVYEKDSILQYITNSRGRTVRCPIGGCLNTTLTEDILEEDDELRRNIRRKKRTVNLLT